MIIGLFLIGFILGLAYTFIGEKIPLMLPYIKKVNDNSWILNLSIATFYALILLFSFYELGICYEFFTFLIVFGLLIIIFISDFKYMIILDSPLIIASLLIIILKFYYYNFKTVLLSIGSALFLFIFMLLISIVGKKIFKREALGGGDIKLALIIGLILGLRLGLIAIIISSLLAMPYALTSYILNKDREVPFGPFLIGSLTLVVLFSDKFLNLINLLS